MSQLTRHRGTDLLAPAESGGLQERLQQASDRAAYLSRVTRDLSGAMHTDRAVDLVLDMLTGPVVDWAQLTLVDRHGYRFRARYVDGSTRTGQLPGYALDDGSSLGRVLSTGATDAVAVPADDAANPVLVSAVPSAALREGLTSIRPMHLLTIALTARGTTYGALSVARRGGTGFDAPAVAFLEDLAHHVALTLDTTRALADSRRIASVLSDDLNPPALPDLGGVELASYYRVAFEHESLGGDFYDVHGDDEEWTAVMGDVCGKGVEAAVLTGKVRQALRTAALIDRDPATMLGLANRVLLVDSNETFVTCLCARGRRVGDAVQLDIASAGHPAPLVVRRDGSVEEVDVSGTVLGLFDRIGYTSVHVELAAGETCLFFTDGVFEAPGRRTRFGEDRIRDVLVATGACQVGAQVESIAVALSAHLQDRVHDDIAILAIQASGTR